MKESEQKEPLSGAKRPGIIHLAVVLAYGLLTVIMTWPLARYATQAIPGDGFDGWQNYWNLWWLKKALVDQVASPFYTDLLYYPTGVNLYFHTLNPLNGLVSLPVQVTSGLIPAYNSIVLVSWVLAGYGVFLLCLWLLNADANGVEDEPLARNVAPTMARYAGPFLAGAVFAFAPFHMAHLLGHMQVMSLQWIPFYVLFLLRGIYAKSRSEPWLRDSLLAGLFLVFSGLSDWYFVLYLFLFTSLVVVYDWISAVLSLSNQRPSSRKGLASALLDPLIVPCVSGLMFLVILSPVLLPMVQEATEFDFMVRPLSDLYILSASITDYVIPNRLHTYLRESANLPGNQIAPVSERTIAIGYSVLVLAAIGAISMWRKARFWLFASVFFLLLSLGPVMHLGSVDWQSVPASSAKELAGGHETTGWTLFSVLNRTLPFMRISRSVSRYALMVQLSASLLAGFGMSAFLVRLQRGAAVSVAAAALALVLVEFWVAPYPVSQPDTPSWYRALSGSGGSGAVLNLPMNFDRPGYLLYQTVHGRPLTVAYISRDDPRTMTERVPVLQHFRHLGADIVGDDPVRVGPTVLHDLDVQYVVLDRYKMPGGEEREYTEALAAEIFSGQVPVYEDARLTVFEVPQVNVPEPYIELGPLNWRGFQVVDNEEPSRSVASGPACAAVRHAGDYADVLVTYATANGAEAWITDAAGTVVSALEAASFGSTAVVEARRSRDVREDPAFCIISAQPDTVRVKRMEVLQ